MSGDTRRSPVALRRARWGFRHRTWIADTGDGHRLVVQRRADGSDPTTPAAVAVRQRVRDAGLLVPEPLRCSPDAGGAATVILPFIVGTVAADLLETDGGAMVAGRACGEVAARLAAIDPAGLGLPGTWSSGSALQAAVRAWVAALDPGPVDDTRARIGGAIEHAVRRAAREVDASGPRFAHGDLAPVNVLVRDGRVAAVLDLDRARPAHPSYDAAWFALAWLWPPLLLERSAETLDDAERARWSERLAALARA